MSDRFTSHILWRGVVSVAVFTCVLACVLIAVIRWLGEKEDKDKYRRAQRPLTYADARRRATARFVRQQTRKRPDRTVLRWLTPRALNVSFPEFVLKWLFTEEELATRPPFAGFHVTNHDRQGHAEITGGTGAGKTTMMTPYLSWTLSSIKPGSNSRLFLYDHTMDLVRIVATHELAVTPILMLPNDVRGWAWDIGRDLTSLRAASQFAANVIPEDGKDQNAFFRRAVRGLFKGVLFSLIETTPGWTFADPFRILKSPHLTRQMLERCDAARSKLRYLRILICGRTSRRRWRPF